MSLADPNVEIHDKLRLINELTGRQIGLAIRQKIVRRYVGTPKKESTS